MTNDLTKWLSVLNNIIPNFDDKTKEKFAKYCEHRRHLIENDTNYSEVGLLPYDLRLLSKIENIEKKKNIKISKTPIEEHFYSVRLNDDLNFMLGNKSTEHYEHLLFELILEDINKQIKNADGIEIYILCKNMNINKEPYRLEMFCDYKINGSREQKLKRILK